MTRSSFMSIHMRLKTTFNLWDLVLCIRDVGLLMYLWNLNSSSCSAPWTATKTSQQSFCSFSSVHCCWKSPVNSSNKPDYESNKRRQHSHCDLDYKRRRQQRRRKRNKAKLQRIWKCVRKRNWTLTTLYRMYQRYIYMFIITPSQGWPQNTKC